MVLGVCERLTEIICSALLYFTILHEGKGQDILHLAYCVKYIVIDEYANLCMCDLYFQICV